MPTTYASPTTVLIAADGLVFMIAFLGGIYLTWQALGVLKWDKFVFDPIGHQTRMLRFILSIIGGFFIASTAVVYMIAAQALRAIL
jgi:uncharacterized membrane protein YwzB